MSISEKWTRKKLVLVALAGALCFLFAFASYHVLNGGDSHDDDGRLSPPENSSKDGLEAVLEGVFHPRHLTSDFFIQNCSLVTAKHSFSDSRSSCQETLVPEVVASCLLTRADKQNNLFTTTRTDYDRAGVLLPAFTVFFAETRGLHARLFGAVEVFFREPSQVGYFVECRDAFLRPSESGDATADCFALASTCAYDTLQAGVVCTSRIRIIVRKEPPRTEADNGTRPSWLFVDADNSARSSWISRYPSNSYVFVTAPLSSPPAPILGVRGRDGMSFGKRHVLSSMKGKRHFDICFYTSENNGVSEYQLSRNLSREDQCDALALATISRPTAKSLFLGDRGTIEAEALWHTVSSLVMQPASESPLRIHVVGGLQYFCGEQWSKTKWSNDKKDGRLPKSNFDTMMRSGWDLNSASSFNSMMSSHELSVHLSNKRTYVSQNLFFERNELNELLSIRSDLRSVGDSVAFLHLLGDRLFLRASFQRSETFSFHEMAEAVAKLSKVMWSVVDSVSIVSVGFAYACVTKLMKAGVAFLRSRHFCCKNVLYGLPESQRSLHHLKSSSGAPQRSQDVCRLRHGIAGRSFQF
mmetsp:Transcript_43336/g.112703  ORF Transcript_43336/g.112703 Transcript_43336/m.112703 type:complete len:583 (-) Transcript_43336:2473-4221(-)